MFIGDIIRRDLFTPIPSLSIISCFVTFDQSRRCSWQSKAAVTNAPSHVKKAVFEESDMASCGVTDNFKELRCLELTSGRRVYYLSEDAVAKNIEDRGYEDDPALKHTDHSDLTAGIYEGGFKVWECSIDLCEYIDSALEADVFKDKTVLELGCGAGLPSIVALQRGAKEAVLQDYNAAVIDCFTKDNLTVNGVSAEKYQLYASDWKTFEEKVNGKKFDIILTSETIYNGENYEIFNYLFESLLSPDGLILLAAKLYYFGIGGNLPNFLEYIRIRDVFDVYLAWTSECAIPRKVIQLTRKFSC